MKHSLPLTALLFVVTTPLWPVSALPQTDAGTPETGHWLAERAASADIVMVGQLDRIDYQYERDFPIAGEAWFKPLIVYKSARPLTGIVVVAEEGLHENECYFPKVPARSERPRYLLFLVRDPDSKKLRGHPDGCALEVLVESTGGYALRWPQPGLGGENGRGDAALRGLVEEMTFQGPGSRIDASDMLSHQRRARAEREFMRIDGTDLIPTRGIELSEIRRLMQPGLETETPDAREQRRIEQLREQMLGDEENGEPGR